MRKKLFSILLILCLVLTLLPSAAVAIPGFKLTVGNTNVSALYEDNWDDTSVHYWKEAESGDTAYAETGSTDDYLFSVSFDWDSDLFTLTLNGVDITSYYKPGSYDYGIYSNTSLNIVLESGTANRIDMSSSSASESSGIHVSGALTISGDGSMSASGGTYGIEAWGNDPSLNITGGTISVSGTAYGSLVDGNVTISGGAVSAAASGDNSDGIAATGDLTVSGGSVTASGNRSALNVNGSTSVTIASYNYRTNTTASAPETGYTYYPGTAFENSGDLKYVEIQGLKDVYIGSTVVSTTAGGVSYWVNDDDGGITSTGADENNYSAKYDNSSSTLTLNGLDLTDSYNNSNPYFGQESLGIYSTGPLNIVLADDTYNSINTVTTENIASISIKAEGDITVGGSGSLSLDAETNTVEGSFTHGIYSSEDITITGGAITVAAADTDSVCGLSAEGDITIEGGSVFIDANNAWSNGIGISTGEGNITISGGTVIALTDNCNSSSYGLNSYTGNIDITGGAVYATGNPSGAAIYSNFGELTPSAPDDSPGGSFDKASVIMTDGENYIPTVLYNSGTIPDFDASNHVVFTGGFPFGYGDSWNTVSDKVYGNFDVSSDHNYTWSAKYRPGDEIFDLTLNECDIASYPDSDRGISTDCGLNLMLKGENSIGAEADPYDSGIYCANGMTVSAENGGSLDIFTDDAGIDAEDAVSFESGDISIIADDTGIQIYGDLSISDGNVTITAGEVGIDIEGTCDVIVSGDETVLIITAGTDDVWDEFYGINCYGKVMIDDATVSIEKLGEYGDGVWARSDIRISGDAQVKIVDWSLSDNTKCGIHSQNGDISIGGGSYVDIVSQSTGIYAKWEGGVYIGYEWDGTNYTPSGSPTVKINNADSIAAVTPQINGNFIAGPYGIRSSESDVRIAGGNLEIYTNDEGSYGIYANNTLEITGGSVTAFGTEQALYAGGEVEPITVNIPAYKHRTNTDAAAVPTTPFSYYPDTAFDVSGAGDYKYVNIASTYAITKAESQNGSFTVMADGVPVSAAAHGDAVTLTAEPDENYSFVSWNVCKTDEESVTCTVENNVFTMPAYPVTIAAVFASVPAATVTFCSNGSVYDTKTVNIGESIGSAAWPANPTRSSYTFGGWFTGENGTGTEFTSVTQVDSSISLYAKWTYSGGGGNSSSNTPPPPQKTITVTETSSELFIDTAGMITAEANMDSAFSNSVEVKVTDTAEDVASFNLRAGDEVYPFDISLYIKGTNVKTEPADGYSVTISLPIPENLVDKRTSLSVLHKSDNGTVTLLDSRLVQKDGVWYLVFEAMEFSPYALVVRNSGSYDESTGVPYYKNVNKNKVFIGFAANGKYIAPEGVIVSVMQNDKDFTDLIGHWAASDIGFTTERDIFLGTGSNKFSPDTGMTRAMFATVIGRLYERSFGEITSSGIHAFTDCDYGVYYGKYVDWAADNGIITGVGNSRFAPDILVTREQMASILYRFADFLKVLPNELDTSLEYPDKASISSYAKNAALYCQTTDIITGRSGGVFAPQETATRAEVSIIIKRFIETVMK